MYVQFILIVVLPNVISGQCPAKCTCLKIAKAEYFVDCSNRNFKEIPANIPVYTTNFDISGNRIKNFTNSTFHTLGKMKILDASRNLLEYMGMGTFKETQKLKTLNLSGNKLRKDSFVKGLFEPLKHSLRELDISHNLKNTENDIYPEECLQDLANLKILKMDCLNGKCYLLQFNSLSQMFKNLSKRKFMPKWSGVYGE